jgi:hypothetical protein
LALVALLLLDLIVPIVPIVMISRARRDASHVFAPIHPPRDAIMCEIGPTSACAAEGARVTHTTVAWMPVPAGSRFRWLVAAGGKHRRSFAYEELTSDRLTLELASDPSSVQQLDYNAHLKAVFEIGGTNVSAYVPNDPTFSMLKLAWSHEGLTYRLYVMPESLLDQPVIVPADFEQLIASVRHVSPPADSTPTASSGRFGS